MKSTSNKAQSFSTLLDSLHHPARLRFVATATMLALGYLCVYVPLNAELTETSNRIAAEKNRAKLASDIEQLRNQLATFAHRVPEKSDTNEWVEYVLGGLRSFPVKLNFLDPDSPRRLGPYQIVVLRIEIEGSYSNLEAFLCWLESNDRLMRVDDLQIAPARQQTDVLVMQLTVLGVMG